MTRRACYRYVKDFLQTKLTRAILRLFKVLDNRHLSFGEIKYLLLSKEEEKKIEKHWRRYKKWEKKICWDDNIKTVNNIPLLEDWNWNKTIIKSSPNLQNRLKELVEHRILGQDNEKKYYLSKLPTVSIEAKCLDNVAIADALKEIQDVRRSVRAVLFQMFYNFPEIRPFKIVRCTYQLHIWPDIKSSVKAEVSSEWRGYDKEWDMRSTEDIIWEIFNKQVPKTISSRKEKKSH